MFESTQLSGVARTFPVTIWYSQEMWKSLSLPKRKNCKFTEEWGPRVQLLLVDLKSNPIIDGEVNPFFLAFFNETGLEKPCFTSYHPNWDRIVNIGGSISKAD